MENKQVALSAKSFFQQDNVKAKFQELLGKEAQGFVTSILQVVSGNKYLAQATPESIYNAAAMAAVLKLPIQNSLGFAYIVPYRNKEGQQEGQFMIGYKGLIQLAQRTGLFQTISACPVYEGQVKAKDPLKGYVFDFSVELPADAKIIGYAAYFALINGFTKNDYWTINEVMAHGQRFSKSFNSGPWKTDFDEMACKTVLKNLLQRYAPLSVEMQKAQIADQAVIKDVETLDVAYVDEGAAVITVESLQAEFEAVKDKMTEQHLKFAERVISNKEEASYTKLSTLLKSFTNE